MSTNPWKKIEIEFRRGISSQDPYLHVNLDVIFSHGDGTKIKRPAFWDGDDIWRVRFAAPKCGVWTWAIENDLGEWSTSFPSELTVSEIDPLETHPFYRHGFWRMSESGRSLVHADGHPAILVADTAWGLPWRATVEQAEIYAKDRHSKGFNAVLLMTIQPDMRAKGPTDRTQDLGFGVGFHDLPNGRLTQIDVSYFQYFDLLHERLVSHELVPVLQPVFQGFGWKGLDTAGGVVPPNDYARYCRYLVARYGASPAIYLVGADGSGIEPQIEAGGREVHATDSYGQPTGIHYRPHAWANSHQEKLWLDFQWCQTGHGGEHVQERVAELQHSFPTKSVANGEPTYEQTGSETRAIGWWQGHEAWANLFAGGTMGVVYGAGSLWQWKLHPNEPGHSDFFSAPNAGWFEALNFEGSRYVGLISRVLKDSPTTDMRPTWDLALNPWNLVVPGKLFLSYKEFGGRLRLFDTTSIPKNYEVVDLKTGQVVSAGAISPSDSFVGEDILGPLLYKFFDEEVKK